MSLLVIVGPLLYLGTLLSLLGPAATDSARHLPGPIEVTIPAPVEGEAPAAGERRVLVEGRPFVPIGVTYHFSRHRSNWDEDLRAMRDMGLNSVRIDLAWRDVSPILPDRYRFGVLDEFLDRAAAHGLYVVLVFSHTTEDLNTPLWFWAINQQWRSVDRDGHEPLEDLPSINHPAYRAGLRSYVEATVRHVRDHPAVLAYQLLNEPRYDPRRLYDYNPHALAAYRQWLQLKYGTVDRLNKAWATAYSDFEDAEPSREATIDPLQRGPEVRQWSDWRQFGYDNLANFLGDLARSVKGEDTRHPVIVAEMAWWWWGEQPYTGVSPLHIYRDADIVGYDLYPDSAEDASYFLFTSDMLSRYWQKPVWVMELNRKDGDPSSDEIREFVDMALEGGAGGIFYFQWRDEWSDGGRYGVLGDRDRRKSQYGGLAATVRWLKGREESVAAAPPPKPDLYLVWPSGAVGEVSGHASPAWELYRAARRIAVGGLRVGLLVEGLVQAVDPQKLLTLRDGRLEGGKAHSPPFRPPTRGLLLFDE